MKTRLEASVDSKIKALFARCPTLYGFAVQDQEADLVVTEIGVFPKLDSQFDEIFDEIKLAIADLVKDQPHAYDFLRGRTFARTLH